MSEFTNIQTFKGGSVMWNDNENVFKVVSALPSVRGKTFKGESAWSAATRYINDYFDWTFFMSSGMSMKL